MLGHCIILSAEPNVMVTLRQAQGDLACHDELVEPLPLNLERTK